MPDEPVHLQEEQEGDVMAGDRRIARADSALPDWYASDAAYRPVPIVWFGGAMVAQVIAMPFASWAALVLIGVGPLATAAILLAVTGFIWHWTWERGMHGAGTGWRIATAAMLVFFLAIAIIGLLA